MQRAVPRDLCRRYDFNGNLQFLFNRIVNHVAPSHPKKHEFLRIMSENKFIPAGSTLVAGKHPMAPNCSIIGEVTDDNVLTKHETFVSLLSSGTGVGLDLTKTTDPVNILGNFASAARCIKLKWGRPLRGNMATLSINHPKVDEFIKCKDTEANKDLSMFNISVTVDNKYMDDNYCSDRLKNICASAHKSGDPGLIFVDRIQNVHYNERIVTTSPCGEIAMYEDETCNLGSINLDAMYVNGKFDYIGYVETIKSAVEFLDLVCDKQYIANYNMSKRSKELRRIGLGVMGFATLLKLMGCRYQSQAALDLSEELACILTQTASETSKKLATIYGPHKGSTVRRNITCTALPPTGGIRRLFGDDGFSIEPYFDEATHIDPEYSVLLTSKWQKYIENGVSKTINLPSDATENDIHNIYCLSYKLGMKGITVYVDASKQNQPRSLKCDSGVCVVE